MTNELRKKIEKARIALSKSNESIALDEIIKSETCNINDGHNVRLKELAQGRASYVIFVDGGSVFEALLSVVMVIAPRSVKKRNALISKYNSILKSLDTHDQMVRKKHWWNDPISVAVVVLTTAVVMFAVYTIRGMIWG